MEKIWKPLKSSSQKKLTMNDTTMSLDLIGTNVLLLNDIVEYLELGNQQYTCLKGKETSAHVMAAAYFVHGRLSRKPHMDLQKSVVLGEDIINNVKVRCAEYDKVNLLFRTASPKLKVIHQQTLKLPTPYIRMVKCILENTSIDVIRCECLLETVTYLKEGESWKTAVNFLVDNRKI